MTNSQSRLHWHAGWPCWRYVCYTTEYQPTKEELEKEHLYRVSQEASGICPNGGMPFEECIRTVCDCFLTATNLDQYVAGCRESLARLCARKYADDEEAKARPHQFTGGHYVYSICTCCGREYIHSIHKMSYPDGNVPTASGDKPEGTTTTTEGTE